MDKKNYIILLLRCKKKFNIVFLGFFFQCRFSEMTAPWVKQMSNHAGAQSPCACGWARTLRSVVWLPGLADVLIMNDLQRCDHFVKPYFSSNQLLPDNATLHSFLPGSSSFDHCIFSPSIFTRLYIYKKRDENCAPVHPYGQAHSLLHALLIKRIQRQWSADQA